MSDRQSRRDAAESACDLAYMAAMMTVGDRMQSEASRLAEWAREQSDVPYEVAQAILGVERSVTSWTEIRSDVDPKGWQPEWKAYWKVVEEDDRTVEQPVAKFVGGPMNGLTVEDQSGDARAFNFDTMEPLGRYRRVETDDGVELRWIGDAGPDA